MSVAAQIQSRPQLENPLVEGLERLPVAPTTLVIFGATGDLAKRKLLPALYHLEQSGLLPKDFAVVGVSWAIPLDIGGDFAGCTASVMNMCGNIGGAISPALLAYLVEDFGWDVPFFVTSALCIIGALIYAKIDASQRIFAT